MKYIYLIWSICFVLISCAQIEINQMYKKQVADYYASGARAFCADVFYTDIEEGIDLKKCEKVYWKYYCEHGVGQPDQERCQKIDASKMRALSDE